MSDTIYFKCKKCNKIKAKEVSYSMGGVDWEWLYCCNETMIRLGTFMELSSDEQRLVNMLFDKGKLENLG